MLYFFGVFRFTRNFTVDSFKTIWLSDMPNVHRIYRLCYNIYLARALRQYRLEEDLLARLLFILRSRELAITVTRMYKDSYNLRIRRQSLQR